MIARRCANSVARSTAKGVDQVNQEKELLIRIKERFMIKKLVKHGRALGNASSRSNASSRHNLHN